MLSPVSSTGSTAGSSGNNGRASPTGASGPYGSIWILICGSSIEISGSDSPIEVSTSRSLIDIATSGSSSVAGSDPALGFRDRPGSSSEAAPSDVDPRVSPEADAELPTSPRSAAARPAA